MKDEALNFTFTKFVAGHNVVTLAEFVKLHDPHYDHARLTYFKEIRR